jgi:hypothetical protein
LGDKFDRLEVLARAPNRPPRGGSWWTCRCNCGTVKDIRGAQLTRKEKGTRSCGCLRHERNQRRFLTHGQSNTKIYGIWCAMIRRCNNPNVKDYPDYGGRGIKVCKRWRKFETFLVDMGPPPPGMLLERKHNDGPYSPDNCRWATRSEQMRNRRNNRLLTAGGLTLPLVVWSERNGVPVSTMEKRLAQGYSDEDVVAPRSFRGVRRSQGV